MGVNEENSSDKKKLPTRSKYQKVVVTSVAYQKSNLDSLLLSLRVVWVTLLLFP
jgi:hypothetical protein